MKRVFILVAACATVFAACNGGANNTNAAQAGENGAEDNAAARREVSSQIAYIHLDSLLAGYDMYNDLSSEFEKKAKEAENDLSSRGRSFEKAVSDFQTKAEKGLLTRSEIAQQQQDLERRQQTLLQHSETKQRELGEENQVMMNKILYSIEEYVAEFNSDYRYGVILTTTGGAPILHADPSLDITKIVVAGLNEKYAKEKSAQ